MKKLFVCLFCSCMFFSVYSQVNNVIFLNSGEKLEYSKFKMGKTDFEYETKDGHKNSLSYDDIDFLIRKKNILVPFETKTRSLLKGGPLVISFADVDPENSCTRGMVDAIQNTNFIGATVGAGLTGILFPIGLIGSAIIAATPPAEKNLNIPENAPIDDSNYMTCYKKTAKKQKSQFAWLGAANGVAIGCAIFSIVMLSSL